MPEMEMVATLYREGLTADEQAALEKLFPGMGIRNYRFHPETPAELKKLCERYNPSMLVIGEDTPFIIHGVEIPIPIVCLTERGLEQVVTTYKPLEAKT